MKAKELEACIFNGTYKIYILYLHFEFELCYN